MDLSNSRDKQTLILLVNIVLLTLDSGNEPVVEIWG